MPSLRLRLRLGIGFGGAWRSRSVTPTLGAAVLIVSMLVFLLIWVVRGNVRILGTRSVSVFLHDLLHALDKLRLRFRVGLLLRLWLALTLPLGLIRTRCLAGVLLCLPAFIATSLAHVPALLKILDKPLDIL